MPLTIACIALILNLGTVGVGAWSSILYCVLSEMLALVKLLRDLQASPVQVNESNFRVPEQS